ncbi:MAG: hypothetical protein IPG75_01525 [Gemmatimonadetes bacterium]|nr:hypothetical protein [Gemmatimonadota bacterium]
MRPHRGRLGVLLLVLAGCGDSTGPGTGGGMPVTLVAAAGDYTCAVDLARHGWCWGAGLTGQLGNGDTSIYRTPQALVLPLELRAISSGEFHSCGLTSDDAAWCWGTNFIGVLGIGRLSGREPVPLLVSGGIRFRGITAGNAHTCGLDRSGAAWCWGQGEDGRLGVGDTLDRLEPTPVQSTLRFAHLAAGGAHTCGVTGNGEAWCWGANFRGQLGAGDTVASALPRLVGGGHLFRTVETGNYYSCGLAQSGAAWCWGDNLTAELGNGELSAVPAVLPVAVTGARHFTTLTLGREHACAVTAAGEAWCWGSSIYGKLGNDDFLPTPVPVAVAGGLRFSSLAAAGNHTCAVTASGAVYCWGRNNVGQFGDSTRADALQPTPVLPFPVP